jgi:hypothetical protein
VGLEDRVGAEGDVARVFFARRADLRLEPLAVGVDQGEGRHRGAENPLGEPGDAVEALLRLGVEQFQGVQRRKSTFLVRRRWRSNHAVGTYVGSSKLDHQ